MKAWDLTELKINNSQGLGSTPNNQNVDYVGLRVMMDPLTFLKLALPMNPRDSDDKKTIDYIQQHLDDPGIGAPFLDIKIPPEWFEGDFSQPASVSGHDGRHRMYAAAAAQGNQPIEVHLFPRGGLRNRDLNAKIVQHLQQGLTAEGSQGYVHGPIFQLADSLQEGRIIFGDEPVDLYLQGKNRQGDLIKRLIKQGVPANRVDQVIRQLAGQFNINPNAIVWGISNKHVDEVAMNPRSFAQSIQAAQKEKVLVGYEFEVCVPKDTVDNTSSQAARQTPEQYADYVQNLIQDNEVDLDIGWEERRFNRFFDVFKFREPTQLPQDVKQLRQAYMADLLPVIIEMFDRVPERKRIPIIQQVKASLESQDSYRRATRLGKQFIFARQFGDKLYYSSRGNLEDLGRRIEIVARRPQKLGPILSWAVGLPVDTERARWRDPALDTLQENFLDYFTYEDSRAAYDYLELYHFEDNDDDYDDSGDYRRAANQVLKPAVESTFGVDVKVFNEYHQARKNLTSWYIEPDGSLSPNNPKDSTAEIVTPPMPAVTALDTLNKFYGMATQLQLYTNNTTGLHINVSIPKTLDVLKLAVLLGEPYVLKYFGRENSGYARSVVDQLLGRGARNNRFEKGFTNSPRQLKTLQGMAKEMSAQHTASVSFNGKYVSFRHAGGDYLKDPTGTLLTVSRFIQAMVIAADPTSHRQEYLATLARMFPAPEKEITNTGPRADQSRMLAALQQVRQRGWPAVQRDVAYYDGNVGNPTVKSLPIVDQESGNEETRKLILDKIQMPSNRQKIAALPPERLVRVIGILPNPVINQNAVDYDFSLRQVGRNNTKKYFYTDRIVYIPASDPKVQQLIRKMAAPFVKKQMQQNRGRKLS